MPLPARPRLLVAALLLICVLVGGFCYWTISRPPSPPAFTPWRQGFRMEKDFPSSSIAVLYDQPALTQFATMINLDDTHRSTLIIDYGKPRIVGVLESAQLEAIAPSGDYILAVNYTRPREHPPGRAGKISEILFGDPPPTRPVNYWLISLVDDQTTHVATLHEQSDCYLRGQQSPDGRYFRVQTSLGANYLFDLANGFVSPIPAARDLWGAWISNHEIVFFDTANGLVLYDVNTASQTQWISYPEIRDFLRDRNQSPNLEPITHAIFSLSTAEGFRLCLTGVLTSPTTDYFVILVYPTLGKLEPVSRPLHSELYGVWNPSYTHYVSSGDAYGSDFDGVYLHDAATSTTRTLVQPTGAGYFSVPRFKGDRVLYFRDSALWSIDLDGSNLQKLFPPAPLPPS